MRISIIFLLVIFFPLIQKQWLNLYLFNINNFTIYKVLYYLSGLIVPILVIINSLDNFTNYKFNQHYKNKNDYIGGKLLLLITLIVSTLLSILITHYLLINLQIFLNLLISNNEYLLQFNVDKKILFVMIISIFLLFKKTKIIIKKIILTNFFVFSIINWYSQINSSFLINVIPFYNLQLGNMNYINIALLLAIEIVYYIWSYISYSSYLSDWSFPRPYFHDISPILNIVLFYLLIILYYSILFK